MLPRRPKLKEWKEEQERVRLKGELREGMKDLA
jgi:hypothetical protein